MTASADFRDVVSLEPLVHRRRISFGDTDAAGIVYTVRFFDFAMGAIEAWFREIYGHDWYELNTELRMGSPFVRIEMDILAPLAPPQILDSTVLVEKIGRSSLTFRVLGRDQAGTEIYRSRYVCAVIRHEPMRAVSIPPVPRARIEAYMRRCDELGLAAEPAPS